MKPRRQILTPSKSSHWPSSLDIKLSKDFLGQAKKWSASSKECKLSAEIVI